MRRFLRLAAAAALCAVAALAQVQLTIPLPDNAGVLTQQNLDAINSNFALLASPAIQINGANYGLVNGMDGSVVFQAMNTAGLLQGTGSLVVPAGSFTNGALGPIMVNSHLPWSGGGPRVTTISPSNGSPATVFQGSIAGYSAGVVVNRSAAASSGSNSYVISTGLSRMTINGNGINATGAKGTVEIYGVVRMEDVEIFNCRATCLELDYNPVTVDPALDALGSHADNVQGLIIHHCGVDVTNNDAVITPGAVCISADAYADFTITNTLAFNAACANLFLGHNISAVIGGDIHLYAPGVGCPNMADEGSQEQLKNVEMEGAQGGANACQALTLNGDNQMDLYVFEPPSQMNPQCGVKLGQHAGEIPYPGQFNQTIAGDVETPATATATGTSGGNTLTLSGVVGTPVNGQFIQLAGIPGAIPANTTATISGSTATLSANLTANVTAQTAYFVNSVTTLVNFLASQMRIFASNTYSANGGVWWDWAFNNSVDAMVDLANNQTGAAYVGGTPDQSNSYKVSGSGLTCPTASASLALCGGVQFSAGGLIIFQMAGSHTSITNQSAVGVLKLGNAYRLTPATQTLSGNAQTVTIFNSSAYDGVMNVTTSGAVTGTILQAGGTDTQHVEVCNAATSGGSITFNATPATSNIAVPNAVAAGTCAAYNWHATGSLWYQIP
jgi:hypothetical protein